MNVELIDINKSFGEKRVLKNISFKAENGAALGLLGRNGAGKSTTIRIIMNIFMQDSGKVLINETSNVKSNVKIGYLPEERGLFPKKTVVEQMVYLGRLRGLTPKDAKKSAVYLLEKLDAAEYLNKRLDTLSKGNQQKIQLAISLINDPDIVILDEPFSGLDPVNAQILKNVVTELVHNGKTVIFSSHQMQYVEEFCQQICIINQGEIVLKGNLNQIKKSYKRDNVFIVSENNRDILTFVKENPVLAPKVSEITERDNGYTVNLKNENDKDLLLKLLLENQIKIDHFGVIEPTLEEIFVEKAGGIHEV